MKRPLLSLKGQALALLSRRDHSRAELRTKLMAHARKRALAEAEAEAASERAGPATTASHEFDGARRAAPTRADDEFEWAFMRPATPATPPRRAATLRDRELPDPGAEVETVLDWLEAQNYLSDARFVESRVNARAGRHGQARIQQELSRLGVAMDADTASQLRDTELERAREVWRRKFRGEVAEDAAGRARQARFLAGRGFAAAVVWRVVGGRGDEPD